MSAWMKMSLESLSNWSNPLILPSLPCSDGHLFTLPVKILF